MLTPLHIVLFEPEIPPNTGNIARLCACTGCTLHLIHPLGFDISDKALRRAGLDYWQHLNIHEHQSWQDALHNINKISPQASWYALSTKAKQNIWQVQYKAGDVLVLGPESRGLPQDVMADMQMIRIPMRQDAPVRSLNLSSACSVITYEAIRQLNLQDLLH